MLADRLESLVPKTISIADAYVPYCYLHPEKITTKRMTIDCDEMGRTITRKGEQHEVVQDLDFEHFAKFLTEYLR